MGQKMINVKPIKNKETLIQFGEELQKGKYGKRDYLIMAIGICHAAAHQSECAKSKLRYPLAF